MISHLSATFGGHRHCASGDITLLLIEEEVPEVLGSICH